MQKFMCLQFHFGHRGSGSKPIDPSAEAFVVPKIAYIKVEDLVDYHKSPEQFFGDVGESLPLQLLNDCKLRDTPYKEFSLVS